MSTVSMRKKQFFALSSGNKWKQVNFLQRKIRTLKDEIYSVELRLECLQSDTEAMRKFLGDAPLYVEIKMENERLKAEIELLKTKKKRKKRTIAEVIPIKQVA